MVFVLFTPLYQASASHNRKIVMKLLYFEGPGKKRNKPGVATAVTRNFKQFLMKKFFRIRSCPLFCFQTPGLKRKTEPVQPPHLRLLVFSRRCKDCWQTGTSYQFRDMLPKKKPVFPRGVQPGVTIASMKQKTSWKNIDRFGISRS